MWVTWREAMRAALYSPGGFYARGESPGCHFRTSATATPCYAEAVLALLRHVDDALGRPARLDVVDVGAGRGELVSQLLSAAAGDSRLSGRVAACAVEVARRPPGLDSRIHWRRSLPSRIRGLVIASEWLDNVPLDVAERARDGLRLTLVDPASGAERPGPAPGRADLAWLTAWWPVAGPGARAEIGRPRCRAWAGVIRRIGRGVAVAVDYGHVRAARPVCGTLTGYLKGRCVPALPDGSRDITAHVALDACAAAGTAAGAIGTVLTTQRQALGALGITARRPPVALAGGDPRSYLRALCCASEEAELLDPAGLGGHGWLVQSVGVRLPAPLAGLTWPEPVAARHPRPEQ